MYPGFAPERQDGAFNSSGVGLVCGCPVVVACVLMLKLSFQIDRGNNAQWLNRMSCYCFVYIGALQLKLLVARPS